EQAQHFSRQAGGRETRRNHGNRGHGRSSVDVPAESCKRPCSEERRCVTAFVDCGSIRQTSSRIFPALTQRPLRRHDHFNAFQHALTRIPIPCQLKFSLLHIVQFS